MQIDQRLPHSKQGCQLMFMPNQGILTEGEGSVQLTSLYSLVQISYFRTEAFPFNKDSLAI